MTELPLLLVPFFLLVSFVNSSVGMAGGSSYTAIMALFGLPISIIPSISLSLNTLVSTIGSRNFIKNNHFRWRLWLPFQLTALPFVHLGAKTELPILFFYSLLLITLVLSAMRLAFRPNFAVSCNFSSIQRMMLSCFIGAVIGFLSGSLGIGGGIYLIPCIILLGIGTTKEAAAVGVVFILINSVIGLATKWQMGQVYFSIILPILCAVAIGGTLGSWFGAKIWQESTMHKMLLIILIIAISMLGKKILGIL